MPISETNNSDLNKENGVANSPVVMPIEKATVPSILRSIKRRYGNLEKWQRRALVDDLSASLRQWWSVEESRLSIFIPVLLGIGIGFYFGLAREPELWIGPAIIGVCCMCIAILGLHTHYARGFIRKLLFAIVVCAIGFTLGKVRTQIVTAPNIQNELAFVNLSGRLIAVENRSNGWRLLIKPMAIEGVSSDALPKKIRVTWRGKIFNAAPGQVISMRASLSPPPSPSLPGGYDFGRQLFFQQIGAVGFAVSTPEISKIEARTSRFIWRTKIEKLRLAVFNRIRTAAPGQGGAIVAAIVTGKREAIDASAEQSLRDSGLAHLLAISGLHMGLATGLVFFGTRSALALFPSIALRYPIKKIAGSLALIGGFGYLILSGAGVSSQRAFVMTSIVFLAILTDRRALSLRNVAIAATLILIVSPEAVLHPGFQMSFAAVTALIAAYEWYTERKRQTDIQFDSVAKTPVNRHHSSFDKLKSYAIGVAVTDTIAAIATAPFALYHFHRTALYSLPANLLAMPAMAFWIMPSIIVAALLSPFGLDEFGWRLAARGIDFILGIGGRVSDLPGAVSIIPGQTISWLVTITIGGCILLLLKAPWRLSGLLCLPIACILMLSNDKPDVMLSSGGQNAGLIDHGNGQRRFIVFDRRRDRFSVGNWMEDQGIDPERNKPLRMSEVYPCDQHGCVARLRDNYTLAFTQSPQSLAQDCLNADLVIALFPVNRRLKAACDAHLIDRRDAWNDGAQSVWISKKGTLRKHTVNARRRGRPWG